MENYLVSRTAYYFSSFSPQPDTASFRSDHIVNSQILIDQLARGRHFIDLRHLHCVRNHYFFIGHTSCLQCRLRFASSSTVIQILEERCRLAAKNCREMNAECRYRQFKLTKLDKVIGDGRLKFRSSIFWYAILMAGSVNLLHGRSLRKKLFY